MKKNTKKLKKPYKPRKKNLNTIGSQMLWGEVYNSYVDAFTSLKEPKCDFCGIPLESRGVCSRKCSLALEKKKEAERKEKERIENERRAKPVSGMTVGELEDLIKDNQRYCD